MLKKACPLCTHLASCWTCDSLAAIASPNPSTQSPGPTVESWIVRGTDTVSLQSYYHWGGKPSFLRIHPQTQLRQNLSGKPALLGKSAKIYSGDGYIEIDVVLPPVRILLVVSRECRGCRNWSFLLSSVRISPPNPPPNHQLSIPGAQ